MKKNLRFLTLFLLLCLIVLSCTNNNIDEAQKTEVKTIDLSPYKDSKPARMMKLLFIHHSCGGQWLADLGDVNEIFPGTCLYISHPNGGGLRRELEKNNYELHEASYKSVIGEHTDVCDWNVKFRDQMDDILKCNLQNQKYTGDAVRNDIVMFKSCFPTNQIISEGKDPGDPNSPIKTIANYKAAYNSLLGYFKAQQNILFVCVTAPPVVEQVPSRIRDFFKTILDKENSVKNTAKRARKFNNWLKDIKSGWLSGYDGRNVVVFDYYDVLTKHGESNNSKYPTINGTDSHPSAEGNTSATMEFIPFLNKAVNRWTNS